MKNNFKILLAALLMLSAFFACKKDTTPFFSNGNAPVLKSSVNTIVPKAGDSASTVLTLSWSNPKYATDSSHQKFIVEMDSSGRNFSHEVTFEADGPLNYSFTGAQLNNMLANFGFSAGNSFSVDIRVTSSYANNNEQYKSNVVTVAMTPYLVPIVLTPSSKAPLALEISNATGNAISFNWNSSTYGNNTINYALQLDTVGGNFANPQVFKYGTSLTATLVENDLNTAAINAGVIGGSTKNVEFRIVSYEGTSYNTALVYSNADTINLTTYVPVPPNLYIVGDATPGGWSNPVSLPSQQFSKLDAVSFGIIINLTAGKSYLFLPVNGDWSHKFGGATDGTAAGGGTILADGAIPGSNTPAPATSGIYQIVVNFQTNKYTVTPASIPTNLYIVGDATPGGWANPVPAPTQQFTKLDGASFGIIMSLTAGKGYLLLPVNGDWTHKYGGATDGTATGGGTLLADGAVPGSNTPPPATTGVYKIVVNFVTNTYTVTPYTGPTLPANITPAPSTLTTGLWIIGDATPESPAWTNDAGSLSTQQFTQLSNAEFQITVALTSGKSYLLLPAAGDWSNKYGGATDGTASGGGSLLFNGNVPSSNTPAPATSGNYLIDVNFLTGTYTVTPH